MTSELVKRKNNPEESVVRAAPSKLSRWHLRKHAKMMVERNVLPPQRENVVSENGLYMLPFHTEEAYAIDEAHNNNSIRWHISKAAGLSVGSLGVIFTPLVLADSRSGLFEIITISLLASFSLLPLPVWLSRSKAYKQLSNDMKTAAFDPFASWAKERYGIEVAYDKDLGSSITTGADDAHLYYVTDNITGDQYRLNKNDDGEIFLSVLSAGQQLAEAPAFNQKQLTTKVSEPERQALPDDAAVLYNQLMSSVALLRKQELSVEESHAVKRTEQAVSTLVKQYHHAVSLAPSEALHRDLVEFFRTQIVFLDGLKQEHANRIVKRMAVEMTAVKEATVVKDVQLTIPR
jgi:hypothetical protein